MAGFVQGAPGSSNSAPSISAAFPQVQTGGNTNVVMTTWLDITTTVVSVTDLAGNVYLSLIPVARNVGSLMVFYAQDIVQGYGLNTVTVRFSNAATPFPDILIAEYSGLNATDGTPATATGSSVGPASAGMTTTNAADIILGFDAIDNSKWSAAGAGYTVRVGSSFLHHIEDQTVAASGAQTATATLSATNTWIMGIAAFKIGVQAIPPDLISSDGIGVHRIGLV